MNKLRFGTAGIPISTENRNTINGIKKVRNLGLDSMELEFVRSVNISEPKAIEVRDCAKKNDVMLTCHGQYFINLNAQEIEKVKASKQRIYKAAKIADLCGGYSMTFHAAYYLKQSPELVFETVKKNMKEVVAKLRDEGHKIWVRPETTGKPTQWGDLSETIKLSQEVEGVLPCIDFSHLHARSNGKKNTYSEFQEQLKELEDGLGRLALDNMHIHVSGINYGPKGEKNHLILKESDMNYKDLLKVLNEFNVKGVVICESPNIEGDAILMQKFWKSL